MLEKLGLLKDGRLVNAAILFFGKAPPMQLRCAVFATTDSATIIDRHDFDGDILELIEEAQKYILKNIHIGMRLKGMRREDVPEISVDALREAIINAFCHRDYHDPDYVHIAIFKDRVEIRNPGGLFGGLTIEKMIKGNVSKRRNPLIADLLRRIQMVEAWGRGMPLILKNAPSAKFSEIAGIFIATFDRSSFADGTEQKLMKSVTSEGGSQKLAQKMAQEMTQKILDSIRRNPTVTIGQLSREIGKSIRSVNRYLGDLKAEGLIERIGPDKGGFWKIHE